MIQVIVDLIIPPILCTKDDICSQEESIYLVFTSCLFIIPAMYSYSKSLISYFVLLALCSIISINYWRKPQYGWRRNIDHIYAKILFFIFLFNGFIHINQPRYKFISCLNLLFLLLCYYLSNTTYDQNNKYNTTCGLYWYNYHMLFHILLTINMLIILYHIH
jgi:hypothetical protein